VQILRQGGPQAFFPISLTPPPPQQHPPRDDMGIARPRAFAAPVAVASKPSLVDSSGAWAAQIARMQRAHELELTRLRKELDEARRAIRSSDAPVDIQDDEESLVRRLEREAQAAMSTVMAGGVKEPNSDQTIFRPLAKEADVVRLALPLRALELAVASRISRKQDPQKAIDALGAQLETVGNALKKHIERWTKDAELVDVCHSAIDKANPPFQKVYNGVYKVIAGREGEKSQQYQAAVKGLRQWCQVGAGVKQRTGNAAQLLADGARVKARFEALIDKIAAITAGAKGEQAQPKVWVEMERLPREAAGADATGASDSSAPGNTVRTGLKKTQRILEKALLRPGSDAQSYMEGASHVCDVVRAMLVAEDMASVSDIVRALTGLAMAKLVAVRRIKDRFEKPTAGGWRDLMVNFVIAGDEHAHICEVQVVHDMMYTARKGLPGHDTFNQLRNAMELVEYSGRDDQLRNKAIHKQIFEDADKTKVEFSASFEQAWVPEQELWSKPFEYLNQREESKLPYGYEELVLRSCSRLKDLAKDPFKLACHNWLMNLSITDCEALETLPDTVGDCAHLEVLKVVGCASFRGLPDRLNRCNALKSIKVSQCEAFTQIPESLGSCSALDTLAIESCESFEHMPANSLTGCGSLRRLTLRGNAKLKSLPELRGCKCLAEIVLSPCRSLEKLPADIGECAELIRLSLSGCASLRELPQGTTEEPPLGTQGSKGLQYCTKLIRLTLSGCIAMESPIATKEKLLAFLSVSSGFDPGCLRGLYCLDRDNKEVDLPRA